jgi:hypothetical protein
MKFIRNVLSLKYITQSILLYYLVYGVEGSLSVKLTQLATSQTYYVAGWNKISFIIAVSYLTKSHAVLHRL